MSIAILQPHTLQQYWDQAMPVFHAIPGMAELMHTSGAAYEDASARYPDAAFALMTANNLFAHDTDLAAIHQQAFFSILEGNAIPSVRVRYDRQMDTYLQKHLWDD